jgi:hypothetical protein
MPTAPAAPAEPIKMGKYICVEISLINVSKDKPWNAKVLGALPKDDPMAPILFDNRLEPCTPVPPASETMETTREIAPGEEVKQVLVFETPAEGFEYVRLVIPAASVSASMNFGFEVPISVLTGETAKPAAGNGTSLVPLVEPQKPGPKLESKPAAKPGDPSVLPPLPGEDGTPEEGEKPRVVPAKK